MGAVRRQLHRGRRRQIGGPKDSRQCTDCSTSATRRAFTQASGIRANTPNEVLRCPWYPIIMAKLTAFLSFVAVATLASAFTVSEKRATGGYVQNTSGSSSFTMYTGCGSPGTLTLTRGIHRHPHMHVHAACGKSASGFTAAISQLSFGSAPGLGAGDACGRCFALTGNKDPYSPNYTGPFGQSIVVKVTDLCPVQGNTEWCSQSTSHPTNQHAMPVQ